MSGRATPEQLADAFHYESPQAFLRLLNDNGYVIVDADRGGDLARMGCPQCPDPHPDPPVMRCMLCGTGYYADDQ